MVIDSNSVAMLTAVYIIRFQTAIPGFNESSLELKIGPPAENTLCVLVFLLMWAGWGHEW